MSVTATWKRSLLTGGLLAALLGLASPAEAQDPCDDFFTCSAQCVDGDTGCYDACLAEVPVGAERDAVEALYACALASGCDEGDDACFDDACGDLWAGIQIACYGLNPHCVTFGPCADLCDDGLDCMEACVDALAEPERGLGLTATTCVRASGCADGDDFCIEEACGSEVSAFTDACGFPGTTPEQVCMEFSSCMDDCDDSECIDECFTHVVGPAREPLVNLYDCAIAAGCDDGDDACLEVACADEFLAIEVPCLGLKESCLPVIPCADACPEDDLDCLDVCFEAIGGSEGELGLAATECVRNSGCTDDPCVEAACGDAYRAFADACGFPPPSPEEVCQDFFGCAETCAEGDASCVEACLSIADGPAAPVLDDFYQCVVGSGCAEGDDPCLEAACGAELIGIQVTCLGFEERCIPFMPCADACPEDDLDCLDACFVAVGGPEGDLGLAATECIRTSGCTDDACFEDTCGDAYRAFTDACGFPPPEPQPEEVCDAFFACIEACTDGVACVDACLADTGGAAAPVLSEFIDCVFSAECPEGDDACLQEACGSEFVAIQVVCNDISEVCAPFFPCSEGCDNDDLECLGACIEEFEDGEEKELGRAAISCAQQSGCNPADEACIDGACRDAIEAFTDSCRFPDCDPANGDCVCTDVADQPCDPDDGDDTCRCREPLRPSPACDPAEATCVCTTEGDQPCDPFDADDCTCEEATTDPNNGTNNGSNNVDPPLNNTNSGTNPDTNNSTPTHAPANSASDGGCGCHTVNAGNVGGQGRAVLIVLLGLALLAMGRRALTARR